MRKRIYEIIEAGNDSDGLSKAYDFFMIVVIAVSMIPLMFKEQSTIMLVIDKVCVGIFIIDYLLRLLTADFKFQKQSASSFLKYPFSAMAIIDLISILPSLIPLNQGLKTLRLVRMIRAFRVVRIFKSFRYSKNISRIVSVLKKSKNSLIAVGFFAIAYVFVAALIIFNVEPDSFKNFFDAIYWATVSLTTVGYGDIYPISTIGRVVTMISSAIGIAIVALPAGIITAGYMNELEDENNDKG